MKTLNKTTGLLAAALASALWTQIVHAQNINLNDGGITSLQVLARDTNISYDGVTDYLFPDALPFSDNDTVNQGASAMQAEYALGQDAFRITGSGLRSGSIDSRATQQHQIFFSALGDIGYSITGYLATVDPSAKGVVLGTTLEDVDTSEILFNNRQASFGVVNEYFELGAAVGNIANELSGSLTGVLMSGHRYSLSYDTTLYASNSGDSASCTSQFEMALTPVIQPFDFAGFLPPIGGADQTGGSFDAPLRTFKLNSTIPIKFTAWFNGSPVVTGIHTLEVIKWSNQTESGSPIDATPTDASTTGNQFRLSDGNEWHFNLDTNDTGMSTGKWQLIATLSDGSQHSVWIQLK